MQSDSQHTQEQCLRVTNQYPALYGPFRTPHGRFLLAAIPGISTCILVFCWKADTESTISRDCVAGSLHCGKTNFSLRVAIAFKCSEMITLLALPTNFYVERTSCCEEIMIFGFQVFSGPKGIWWFDKNCFLKKNRFLEHVTKVFNKNFHVDRIY